MSRCSRRVSQLTEIREEVRTSSILLGLLDQLQKESTLDTYPLKLIGLLNLCLAMPTTRRERRREGRLLDLGR